MKLPKRICLSIILGILLFFPYSNILAVTYDFILTNNTTVTYTTGEDTVDVKILFLREVKNKEYFFSTSGEQSFHIPDLVREDQETVKEEREFKKASISVTNDSGKKIPYTIEDLEYGEGMYVKVPNYKQTTYTSPYRVIVKYSTHDYVKNVYNWVLIEYPALHEDTKFEQIHDETDTKVKINYNLDIVVDKDIPPLARIFPETYNSKEQGEGTSYSFSSDQRVGKPTYLEFGTKQIYKFELSLKTSKTDDLIPERYSSAISALSTNIYELALPREYSENKQSVRIEKISPTPTKLITNTEGNVIATFEVPANQESEIYVSGYIWLEQEALEKAYPIPNITYTKYLESIKKNKELAKYLIPTKYWEVKDPIIDAKAKELLVENNFILDIIRADYSYITQTFEYNKEKANDPNSTRIGAKAALQGGATVCMEYSDAMVAILRAQGIPARAAFGYTSLDTNTEDKVSHQWVQVWLPDYGWLSVDPSYESANMMIGQSLQYILWNTLHDDNFVDIKAYSADNFEFDTSKYKVKVYAVSEDSIPENVLSYSDIQPENTENSTKETLNLIIKTTPIGKALVIILPITVVLLLLITLFSLITLLIKRVKARKASVSQLP